MISKVSVIVTCYNQECYLAEALNSVLVQTYQDWECIIINDGSTDASEVIAKSYITKDPRFKYIYQENQGVVAARNNAIAASTGKYILPLDGDDKIAPLYIELAVQEMEQDNSIGLVYCDVEYFGQAQGKMYLPKLTPRNILHTGCCVNASLFCRVDYDFVGGYKDNMNKGWEDWDFFISIVGTGKKVKKIEKVLFYYRIASGSRSKSFSKEDMIVLRCNMVRNTPLIWTEEYQKLYNDWFRYEGCTIIRDARQLIDERPIYCKIIHFAVLFVKGLRRIIGN